MKYDKNKYNRKSIRLKGYNYSQLGMYFITICCKDQISRFGEIVKGKMILNDCGKIAFNEWKSLPIRFPQMKMDALQIMPNHMHAIVNLVGATLAVAPIPVAPIPVAPIPVAPIPVAPIPVAPIPVAPIPVARDFQGEEGAAARAARTVDSALLGDIIGAYKSLVAKGCLEIYKSKKEIMGKLWHRNYYEVIIRDESNYVRIKKYILNNPLNWKGNKSPV